MVLKCAQKEILWMLKEVALSNLRTLKAQQVFRLSRGNLTILMFGAGNKEGVDYPKLRSLQK